MAALDVSERTIEATIAFVGSAGARERNLARMGREPRAERLRGDDGGEWVQLRPSEPTLRDCTLKIRVVPAPEGDGAERAHAVLRDADAVILAVEGGEAASNLSLARSIREAWTSGRGAPVVVQIDRSRETRSGESVLATLGEPTWAFVEANLPEDQGIVETFRRATALLAEALAGDGPGGEATREVGSSRAAEREGNPLLRALQEVLRETAERQSEELDRRSAERVEQAGGEALAPIAEALERIDRRLGALEAEVREVRDEAKKRKRGWFS